MWYAVVQPCVKLNDRGFADVTPCLYPVIFYSFYKGWFVMLLPLCRYRQLLVLLSEPVQELRLCLRRECACRYVCFYSLNVDCSCLDRVINIRLYPCPYNRQTFVEYIRVRAVDDASIPVLRSLYPYARRYILRPSVVRDAHLYWAGLATLRPIAVVENCIDCNHIYKVNVYPYLPVG